MVARDEGAEGGGEEGASEGGREAVREGQSSSATARASSARGAARAHLRALAADSDAAGGLIVSDAGGLDADAQIVTKVNAILADTGTDGVLIAAGGFPVGGYAAGAIRAADIAPDAIGASELAADAVTEIAAGVLAAIVETGFDVGDTLRLVGAFVSGELSGAATITVVTRSLDDLAVRGTYTVDADGNRSAAVLTP